MVETLVRGAYANRPDAGLRPIDGLASDTARGSQADDGTGGDLRLYV